MNFIHAREYLKQGDIVVVNSDHQCNVLLMTDAEFRNYRAGHKFRYHGGSFKAFPAEISVPATGNWNITLDLGGRSAHIKYSISYIKNS